MDDECSRLEVDLPLLRHLKSSRVCDAVFDVFCFRICNGIMHNCLFSAFPFSDLKHWFRPESDVAIAATLIVFVFVVMSICFRQL